MKHLFCLGYSFTAQNLARLLPRNEWQVSGTTRKPEGLAAMAAQNVQGYVYADLAALPKDVTHVLASIPPDAQGDPAVHKFAGDYSWIAYLSTTGVYGDRKGGWVSEDTAINPTSRRAQFRALAETQWSASRAHIFRLPGIYGPGRSQLDSLRDGSAKRVIKKGHVFSRIHVEDIAGILAASIARPNPGAIYNVADDEPCPPQEVVEYAAKLLGMEPPPEVAFEEAQLSPMARSFYDESKRVSNHRIKSELGYVLKYPNYREGLTAIHESKPLTLPSSGEG